MYQGKSFVEIMAEHVEKQARELAWQHLTIKEQEAFRQQAKQEQNEQNTKLAIKCMQEAKEAFDRPGFVSRNDPKVYSDYGEKQPKKKLKKKSKSKVK